MQQIAAVWGSETLRMKILAATDGSKHALSAVKYAVGLLRQMASTSSGITLISVHDDIGLRHESHLSGMTLLRSTCASSARKSCVRP